ncbi:MAG: ribokinase [Acidimicrobiales bacterium]|nr:ribokinase [Acidimicrobiales bacterium]
MRDPSVIVVGSANLDVVVPVAHHPVTGETVMGGDHVLVPGGKGANQAVAAARQGAEVAFVGRVGDDDAGRTLRASMNGAGVGTTHLSVDAQAPSGIALIGVDADGDNTIIVSPGANARVRLSDIAGASDDLANASVVLLQLEVPIDVVTAAANTATGTVILNPAPAPSTNAALPRSLLNRVDVLVPNAIELAQLTGSELIEDVEELAAVARGLGVETVVVTRGGAGALIVTANNVLVVPAPDITPVDTTGAGDSFCGALAAALASGAAINEAVQQAVHAGAIAATRSGAQPSMPTAAEVDASLNAGGTVPSRQEGTLHR